MLTSIRKRLPGTKMTGFNEVCQSWLSMKSAVYFSVGIRIISDSYQSYNHTKCGYPFISYYVNYGIIITLHNEGIIGDGMGVN